MVIDYQQFLNVLIQILKLVIDYTYTVIDYQSRFSENILNSHIFLCGSWMAIKGLYICDLRHEFAKSFSEQKGLILLKSKIVLSSYKFLGQITCDSIRNYLSAQIVQSISFKRDFFFSSSYFWKGIKRPRVSCCERILNTKEGLSLCV